MMKNKLIALVCLALLTLAMIAAPVAAITRVKMYCGNAWVWYYPDYGTFSGRFARLVVRQFLMGRCHL